MRIFLLAALTMVAFAANSVFARIGLYEPSIDPASYTTVRITSGALMLAILAALQKKSTDERPKGSLVAALALAVYAVTFSFAYVTLDTGVGALILFALVQSVMIGWGLYSGERPSWLGWLGIASACIGFIYLVSPGFSAPDPFAAVLMAICGGAWGVYSLMGRTSKNPLLSNASNFLLAVPFVLLISLMFISQFHFTWQGIAAAVASGAITSALGYALWYNVLKHLTATNASVIQLTVPVIAALGGIIFISEPITLRFAIASVAILGGVAITILSKDRA